MVSAFTIAYLYLMVHKTAVFENILLLCILTTFQSSTMGKIIMVFLKYKRKSSEGEFKYEFERKCCTFQACF